MLGLVCCAVALVLAFPFRSYLAERAELTQQMAHETQLQDQLSELNAERAALTDPDYIRKEARARLQYVEPGDTVYAMSIPTPSVPAATATATGPGSPWYSRLWDTLSDPAGGSRPAGR